MIDFQNSDLMLWKFREMPETGKGIEKPLVYNLNLGISGYTLNMYFSVLKKIP